MWHGWIVRRLWAGVLTLAYILWAVVSLPRQSGWEFLFGVIVCPVFLVFYLIPIAVFSASVELVETGLRVRQYGETTLPYSDVLKCCSIFAVPFQVLLIITRKPLPLKFLYCNDRLTEPRTSLTQDGEMARALKARTERA